jgi:hypothetical protein
VEQVEVVVAERWGRGVFAIRLVVAVAVNLFFWLESVASLNVQIGGVDLSGPGATAFAVGILEIGFMSALFLYAFDVHADSSESDRRLALKLIWLTVVCWLPGLAVWVITVGLWFFP